MFPKFRRRDRTGVRESHNDGQVRMADKTRLSLNQITTAHWSVAEAVEGCVRHGVRSIALWRHKIEEAGLAACVRAVSHAGLHVSSVCRGGMFPAATAEERRKKIEDNFRAADEAAALQCGFPCDGGRWLRGRAA